MFPQPIRALLKTAIFTLVLFLSQLEAAAQILQATGANTPPFTPQNLIENIFLGQGVDVSNITFQGDPSAVGYFTGGQGPVGIERGIVLTTGQVVSTNTVFGCEADGVDFASSSNAGGGIEPDLDNLVSTMLNDVAVYTITFTPTSDTLRFKYCFASEEYPEYACSNFNDVFGFFIQGPNYPVPTNIALIPGTSLPVTINNIHPLNLSSAGPCPPTNEQFYNNNLNSTQQPTYDGFTDVFTAEAVVVPCQQYTIKLAIADAGDAFFDSAVFLEAKSFGTGSIRATVSTPSADGTLTEGCSNGSVTFSLPIPTDTDLPLDYNIWGSATNGVDYTFIASNQPIPAGSDQLQLIIQPLEDNVVEGTEFIAIDVQRDPCTRDTVYLYIRENALVAPALQADTTICLGELVQLDGTLPIPVPPPYVFSNPQDIVITPTNTAVFSAINVFGVQPTTLDSGVIRSVCININHNWVDDLDVFLISPGGQFIELTTDNGANGDNYVQTCFTPTATTPINFPGPFAPASAAPFTGDFKPEGIWSDLWGGPVNGQWRLQIVDDQNGFVGTLTEWSITFEPSYKINYSWTPNNTVSCPSCPITSVTPTQTTNYTVIATDSYGCQVYDSVTVLVQPTLSGTQVECGPSTVNSITFVWDLIPGSQGYEININGTGWISPQTDTSHTVNGLNPNTVLTAEVRGINSISTCPAIISTATCSNCAAPVLSAIATSVSCFGSQDGTATISTDNQNPPYNFRVGATSNSDGLFNNLAAGAYICVVTDASGCTAQTNFIVGSPGVIISTLQNQSAVSCFGDADGIISISASGGTGTLSYLWNDSQAQTSPNAVDLVAGTYTVTITDLNGCFTTSQFTITQPSPLTCSTISSQVKCNGGNSGSITASATGGNSSYQYAWSTGQTNSAISGLSIGTYQLTVVDAKGCTTSTSVTLSEPPALTLSLTTDSTSCANTLDGSITASPLGGSPPYQFSWSPSGSGNPIVGLAQGTYTVTITDNNQCTNTASATLSGPAPLQATLSTTSVTCFGGSDGTALANPIGGNGGYQFLWNNPGIPQTTAQASGLSAGNYTVTLTDNKSCTATASIAVNQGPPLQSSVVTQNPSCNNGTNGSATLQIIGGATPYQYLWSNGQTGNPATALSAGSYTVTITDANQCSQTTTVLLDEPMEMNVVLSTTPALCHNTPGGSITATITGGSGSVYAALWEGPGGYTGQGLQLNALLAGTYVATITDGAGCSQTATTNVTQPTTPLSVLLPAISDTICFNGTDGTASALAQGGTSPYSYSWNNPQQTQGNQINNLSAGVYSVTIRDANNCTITGSTQIIPKGELFVFAETTTPKCHNGQDGTASVSFASYGSSQFSPDALNFQWNTSPPQFSRVATGLPPGNYQVTATDSDGCTALQSAIVENTPLLEGSFTSVKEQSCFGTTDAEVTVNGSGGTPPYTYFWSSNVPVQTAQTATQLSSGTYQVSITDAKQCVLVQAITLAPAPAIQMELIVSDVKCFGENTGSIQALTNGGVPPFSYQWSTAANQDHVKEIGIGNYQVTVTDSNNCTLTRSAEVNGPASPLQGFSTARAAGCFESYDGQLEISATGGTAPYRYSLDGQTWNGSPIQIGLFAGVYQPSILDANGCTSLLQEVTITQNEPVQLDLGPDITIELGEDTQFNVQVLQATPPYELQWGAEGARWLSCTDCLSPVVSGLTFQQSFSLQLKDALGCTGHDTITVFLNKPRRVYVPTGFTPNGDNNNDLLMVHGQSSAKILEFKVFDRWGELLFEAYQFSPNAPAFGWDGRFRGQEVTPENYVWTLEVEYLDGVREVLFGHSALIR